MDKIHWLITLTLAGLLLWPATTKAVLATGAEWFGRALDAAIAQQIENNNTSAKGSPKR